MIRLRTLGALDLRAADGEELRTVLAQPKRFAVLAYLALARPRGAHRRDTLLALFWPELDPEHARNALSQSVHFLRRSLGADAITNRGGDELAINRDLLWCDAVAFEDALDGGRLAEAVELSRGDLLQGFHLTDAAVEFERWVESERDRLRRREVAALESLARKGEEAGDFGGAVVWWQRLAARDPLSSRIALGLMRAFASAGDPGAALRHARVHETLLKDELDVAPDPEIGAFARQLRSTQVDRETPALSRPEVTDVGVAAHPGSAEARPAQHTEVRLTNRKPGSTRGRRTTVLVAGLFALGATIVIVSLGALRSVPAAPIRIPATLSLDDQSAGARELRVAAVSPPGSARIPPGAPDSSKQRYLHELLNKAHLAEVNRSPMGLQTAMLTYQRAIELDSTYAPAYAGLSTVHQLMAEYNYAPARAALDSSQAMARRAVALDSLLPEAHTAIGMSLANAGHFESAEREFQRAIALDPDNAGAHYLYAVLLIALGRGEEALVHAERSLAVDHFPPRGATTMKRWALFLVSHKRPHRQLPVREREVILREEPGEPWAHAKNAMDLAEEGRCAEARAELEVAQRLVPPTNLRMMPFVGSTSWLCGKHDEAREVLRELKRHPDVRDEGMRVAWLHARFGERDSAFAWLERQQRWSVVEVAGLTANEAFDSLRTDRRLAVLLRRLRSSSDLGREVPRE